MLERSSLEELEILHLEAGLDLDRQTSLKRLAIDASALDRLPLLRSVEEMVLMNPQGDIVSSLERICPHGLSLLTLVGAHDDLHAIDTSFLSVGTRVAFVVTSPPQVELDELESVNFRRSSHASLSSISLTLNDSWTNATLDSSVCISDPSAVTSVSLTCPTTMTMNWFRLPTCVSTFPALTQISITRCQMPAFNALPPTVTQINLQSTYGTWTQREAGVNPNGPNSEYFDWSWLSSVPNLLQLSFFAQPINGTLPNEFSHSNMLYWTLGYTDATITNHLVGTISRDWFLRYPATLTLNLAYHGLTGTIPNYGLEKLLLLVLDHNQFTHWPPLIINATAGFGPPSKLATVNLDNNNLLQIPSESDFQAMQLTQFYIRQNPSLSAPFPNIFATTTQRTSSNLVTGFGASGCQFYGDLPEIPAYQVALYSSSSTSLTIFVNNNLINGTIPSSWSSVSFFWLDLSNNPMVGTLATIDSNGLVISQPVVSDTSLFRLSSNFVTGPMFNISAMPSLSNLILTLPNVDFCASYRAGYSFASKTLTFCILTGNATMCPEAYPPTCVLYAAATPLAPVNTALEECPMPSPGASFVCIDAQWVSDGSVDVGTLSVPRSSVTIIQGNLTTSSLIIASATSTINVTGCFTTIDGTTPPITVTLTQEDLDEIIRRGGKLTTVLLQQSSECGAIGASVVNVDTRAIKSCKKIETNKISSSSTISMTFRVSNSGCNTWWIILVSVVCGVIILAIGVVIVLAIVWRPFREKIRPFSRKRSNKGAVA